MASAQREQLSPSLFFDTVSAYQKTAALKAAVELDLFTAIDEGAADPAAIAKKCHASERGIRILADGLTICGFLTKHDGRYGLTADSRMFLSRRSPACVGGVVHFLFSPWLQERFNGLTDTVRQGSLSRELVAAETPEHPVWVQFARDMMPMMSMPAQSIASILGPVHSRVLDLAAGHGIFGITIARQNPDVHVVAVDWPNVLEVAEQNARAFGVADRYATLPGSAFEVEFGEGYDVVLLTNFLHHFSPETNLGLLKKVHAALRHGGRAVTLEMVPNEDRVSPPPAAAFSMVMLATTAEGDAYTFSEYDTMFRNAGFSHNEHHVLPGMPGSVIVSTK